MSVVGNPVILDFVTKRVYAYRVFEPRDERIKCKLIPIKNINIPAIVPAVVGLYGKKPNKKYRYVTMMRFE